MKIVPVAVTSSGYVSPSDRLFKALLQRDHDSSLETR